MLSFSGARTLVSLWYQGFGEVGFLRVCTRHGVLTGMNRVSTVCWPDEPGVHRDEPSVHRDETGVHRDDPDLDRVSRPGVDMCRPGANRNEPWWWDCKYIFANRGQYRDEPANSGLGWTGLNRGKYLDGGTAALYV